MGAGGLAGSWAAGSNSLLEQDGISVRCHAKSSTPVMTPFWQVEGIQAVTQAFTGKTAPVVYAGNVVSAVVYAPDDSDGLGERYFQVIDLTAGGNWTAYYKMPTSDYQKTFKSVEVITEWSEAYHCPGDAKSCPSKDRTRDGFVDVGPVAYSYADWLNNGAYLASVAQGKISLWSADYTTERVYPTNPSSSPESPVKNDAFSTEYEPGWTGDF